MGIRRGEGGAEDWLCVTLEHRSFVALPSCHHNARPGPVSMAASKVESGQAGRVGKWLSRRAGCSKIRPVGHGRRHHQALSLIFWAPLLSMLLSISVGVSLLPSCFSLSLLRLSFYPLPVLPGALMTYLVFLLWSKQKHP